MNLSNTSGQKNSIFRNYSKLFYSFKDDEIQKNSEESICLTNQEISQLSTQNKIWVCFYKGCEKTFTCKISLENHEYIHLSEKPFKCEILGCNKFFPNQCRLALHMRIHTGEKPYKCNECSKSFNEKGNLKTHLRIHSGEKPYLCNYKDCTQSFRALGHLRDHEKKHFGIKPFDCNICKAKFSRASTLKIHVRTHSSEKLYQCPALKCGKKFREKGNMKNHYKLHLIKTNLFNIDEMKIERIQNFELNIKKESNEDKSNLSKTNEDQTKSNDSIGPCINCAKICETRFNRINYQDYMQMHNQNGTLNFYNYLQNSFNLNEIYNIFKPSF